MSIAQKTAVYTDAKYDSHCRRCSERIHRGDRIVYVPDTRSAFCTKRKACGSAIWKALRAPQPA